MRCPICAYENPPGARFCASCGSLLERICPVCGVSLPADASFCTSCGTRLDEEAAPAAPRPAQTPAVGERRVVTVLFADLVGFTTLAEHLDPEELRTLMTETLSELTEEVERREGWVEKFIGDAIVAVFGAPVAHEDDPARAVETALAMLDAVRRRSETTPSPLQLRIGINTGPALLGTVGTVGEYTAIGDTVNLAQRLEAIAAAGTPVAVDDHDLRAHRRPHRRRRIPCHQPPSVRYPNVKRLLSQSHRLADLRAVWLAGGATALFAALRIAAGDAPRPQYCGRSAA